jgi:hypothetical protein
MRIRVDTSALRQAKWSQYAVRFLFGGLITTVAGLVARECGPVVGGLLLAFPAIFPAGATLIEKHEKQRKETKGMNGTVRGRQAASVDAAGSAIGSLGLLSFGFIVWQFAPDHRPWAVLLGATAVWFLVAVSMWQIRKHARIANRRRPTTHRD